ncbi:MAG: ChbG/HpnK family deacetylase [Fibrobacteria bacterium]
MAIPANLIINADDFGLDPRISRGIALCLDEGLINSFSVFPFSDDYHAALLSSILEKHPQAKVGAHLSLIGPAMEEHRDHHRDFLRRYLTLKIKPAEVRTMWREQVEVLGAYLGGTDKIAHLDSHQHLHVLPGLWQAAKSLQVEFSIPRLRVPYESLVRAVGYRFPFGLGMQVLARMRREKGSPGFIGFFTSTCFSVEANRVGLAQVMRRLGMMFELMVHPAIPASGGHPTGSTGEGDSPVISQIAEVGELRRLKAFFEA